MHWIKLGLEVLKHAWKSFPLLMRTDVWGQHLLALGPSRDIPSCSARDGDSIPFSMTWLSGFLRGLSQSPHPEMVLLLITVVLVPLVGKLGREIALPLIFVDLVPRVGGLGAKIFFRNALD